MSLEDTEAYNGNRIAKNTLLLYLRMLFVMAISLYTSRIVLNTLGVEDFGIYNVVGGVVAMFGLLNNAMTTSTLRYITYELGAGNANRLKRVFVTSVNIHAVISFFVVLLGETVGLWFLLNKMVIPEARISAAIWVYQISIFTTVVAIMSYPYNAVIIAHERMSAFAYISIIEVLLKLVIVYMLTVFDADKLIVYALLLGGVQVLIRFIYTAYCSRNFVETKYFFLKDVRLAKEMFSFAGWNLWGTLAGIFYGQGLNVLLNIFFGPAVNAARAVSCQVQVAINQFAMNFQMALNPQITKSYAKNRLSEMHTLIFSSSKYSFYLLLVLCLPVILETDQILLLWLKTVPEYTSVFLKLIIVVMIVDSMSNSLMTSAAATGKVKVYQSVIGGILLMIVPISYIVLKLDCAPWSVYVVHLAVCCAAFVVRLFIIRPMIKMSILRFFSEVLVRCFFVLCLASFVPVLLHLYMKEGLERFILTCAVSFACSAFSVFFVGLKSSERNTVLSKIKKIMGRV